MTKRNWYKHFDVVYRKYCLNYKFLKHVKLKLKLFYNFPFNC